jgi:protein-S-isoprenylcysteine O-methyltransferase Ste14
MKDYSGKPTVSPWLFYAGKSLGYLTWIILVLAIMNPEKINYPPGKIREILSYVLIFTGIVLFVLSSFHLGSSLRIGLPGEGTSLKTGGLYRFSRNPMYLGMYALTLAAIIYTFSLWVFLPGLFSMVVYHLIVLGEEKFLAERFGDDYLKYRQRVRRYL